MVPGDDDVSWWAKLAGAAAAAFTAIFGVWKHTHVRIDKAYAALEQKADKHELDRQRNNIAQLFNQQREGELRVLNELRNTNEILTEIRVGVEKALGQRPTREEVLHMMANNNKGGA